MKKNIRLFYENVKKLSLLDKYTLATMFFIPTMGFCNGINNVIERHENIYKYHEKYGYEKKSLVELTLSCFLEFYIGFFSGSIIGLIWPFTISIFVYDKIFYKYASKPIKIEKEP